MDALTHLCDLATIAPQLYYRLILVIGRGGTGKTILLRQAATTLGASVINLGVELSARLLEVDETRRPLAVAKLLRELTSDPVDAPSLLDNLELLFYPALRIEPLSLLQQISRNRTLIVTWRGEVRNGALAYAQPGHPEYRRYPLTADMLLVDLNQESGM